MPLDPTAALFAVLLLIRIGQIFFVSGSVRSKNAAGAAMRLLLEMAVTALVLWAIGIGFLGLRSESWFDHHVLFQDQFSSVLIGLLPICLIATGAVSGAISERTRIAPLLIFAGVSAVVLPLLMQIGRRLDFAPGMGIAIAYGGAAALIAAKTAGPRKGKFNRDQSVNFIPGHNVTFQIVGVLLMLAGFAAASGAAVAVVLGSSAAILAAAAFGYLRFGKIDTGLTLAGLIGGFCAAGVGIAPVWAAVAVGFAAGIVVPWAVMTVEIKLRVDDVTASVATHLVGGVLGLIAAVLVGKFIDKSPANIAPQLLLIVIAIAAGAAIALAIFGTFKSMNKLRISESTEFDGTDLAELDLNAYPDFQQNMIKSYHLREV